MTWHVWTDGSCKHGLAQVPRGELGWGGWCAIVEHGSDGEVLRGRVPATTNVRMELRAAIEGLRVVPDHAGAVLYTDCTTLLLVHDRWANNEVGRLGPDGPLWLELDHEFERVGVRTHLIVKGEIDPTHRRAHAFAGAEASAGLRGLAANATPLDQAETRLVRKGMRRIARASYQHKPACTWAGCVSSCPIGNPAVPWWRDRPA